MTKTKKRPAKRAARLKRVPAETAICFTAGSENELRRVLAKFGTLEPHLRQRILVLHLTPKQSSAALRAALRSLQMRGLVKFTTPVLLDVDSGTRQVLTDEIVVRLKPGTARRTIADMKAAHGLAIQRGSRYEPSQYIAKVPNPSGLRTLQVARALDRRADVECASPNFLTEFRR
jgi:hypothetical protein